MNQLSFRNLVGVAYSEAEMKALAEEQEARQIRTSTLAAAHELSAGRGRAK